MTNIDKMVDNQNLNGSLGKDFISNIGDNNIITAKAGNDTLDIVGDKNKLFGNRGNDTLDVVGESSMLVGGYGNDLLDHVGDNSNLTGGVGNDTLDTVGSGNTLTGGAGNDVLDAIGNDTLIGGAGKDTFRFTNATKEGDRDRSLIKDYVDGQDKLGLPKLQQSFKNIEGITINDGIIIGDDNGNVLIGDEKDNIIVGDGSINLGNGNFNPQPLAFKDLTITQQGQNTAISYQGDLLAQLQGVSAGQITASDFVA
jgi:hypothetical protein